MGLQGVQSAGSAIRVSDNRTSFMLHYCWDFNDYFWYRYMSLLGIIQICVFCFQAVNLLTQIQEIFKVIEYRLQFYSDILHYL